MDFGAGQGATRSADIRSDLGQASNEGQRQNQRNAGGREAKGQLAASLVRYSPLRGCASFASCHLPFCLYARPIPAFQQSPRPGSDGCFKLGSQLRSTRSAVIPLHQEKGHRGLRGHDALQSARLACLPDRSDCDQSIQKEISPFMKCRSSNA